MSYAALMVHLDVERACDRRAQLAIELAERFGAALIGISGWAPRPAFMVQGIVVDATLAERDFQAMNARLDEMGKKFRSLAKQIEHVEWRGTIGFPTELLVRNARAADLIIIGREPAPGDLYSAPDTGAVLLRAGRPVLMVPDAIGSFTARRVVVAWKDTREARRAVRDALPFMQAAEEVLVVEICEEERTPDAQREIDDVTRYLIRHKVIVGAQACLRPKGAVSGELLHFATEERADLLIAGAYGHSRLGEWIFGGVTRDLVAASPICCLLSH